MLQASPTTPTRAARSPARSPRIMCGARLQASSAEMAAVEGPVRRLRQEPRADAAGDGHAPRRGLRDRSRPRARTTLYRAACEDWDDARAPRRGARLPQRAGHRARADRHHRPADGLRHHRHRARLRAREVQEARRRRLLQDRQPVGAARRSGASATREREVQEIVAYVVGHEHAARRAARQPRARSRRRASPTRSSRRSRRALPGVFDLERAFAPWVLGEEALRAPRRRRRSSARDIGLLAARAPRLHAARDRRGERRSSSAA